MKKWKAELWITDDPREGLQEFSQKEMRGIIAEVCKKINETTGLHVEDFDAYEDKD